MTAYFWLSLLALAASPGILRWRFGTGWAMRPFSLLVFAAIVYHGLSEIVIRALGDRLIAPYRPPQPWLDDGMLIASLALLTMTVGYVAVSRPGPNPAYDRADLARVLDWRLTGLMALPLIVYTVRGAGYGAHNAVGLASVSYASQFLLVLVVLTSLAVLLQHPTWFVGVIITQTAIMALAGQRLEVVTAAVTVGTAAALIGLRPQVRQVAVVAVVLVAVAIGISSVRTVQGRDVFFDDTGTTARLSAIWTGITHPTYTSAAGAGMPGDVALRLDGNTWVGSTMVGLENRPPLGFSPIGNAVINSIPTVLYPQKANRTPEQQSPALEIRTKMGMVNGDVAQGHIGLFLGALGPWLLLVFLGVVGALLGLADRWAMARATAVRLLAFILLGQSALQFERGLSMYLLAGRSLVVLGVILLLWSGLRQSRLSSSTRRTSLPRPVRR